MIRADIIDELSQLAARSANGEFDDGDAFEAAELLTDGAGELALDVLTVARWLAEDEVTGAAWTSTREREFTLAHIRVFTQTVAEFLDERWRSDALL